MAEVNGLQHFVGLDLGPAGAFTALAVLERPLVQNRTPPALRRPAYALRYLRRFPPGTPYPDVVEALRLLLLTPPLRGCILAVDRTGVGRAVAGLFEDRLQHQVTCTYVRITITAGQHPTAAGSFMVPRQELVGTLQVLLQTRRLQVASGLPDAPVLVRELEAFRAKPPTTVSNANPEAWREGEHDDLVLAVGIAAWCGEQVLPPSDDPPPARPRRYIAV
jgi:hypothetical protein